MPPDVEASAPNVLAATAPSRIAQFTRAELLAFIGHEGVSHLPWPKYERSLHTSQIFA